MKQNVVLTITSLLSILFMTFHLTDDIIRGMEPGGLKPHWVGAHPGRLAVRNAGARRTAIGYVIILLGSLLGAGIPVIHMGGRESAARSPSPAEPSSSSGRSSRSA